jgi:CII-binding regulator of phage lambda lysogenization HflD
MTAMLERLVHTVESSLLDLGRRLCQPSPREQLRDEIDRLTAQLRQREAELTRARMDLAALKRRLRDNPSVAALLPSHIELAVRNHQPERAWRYALELDQLRHSLAADQEASPRLEQTCWSLQFLVRQLERRLDRLSEQLYPHGPC